MPSRPDRHPLWPWMLGVGAATFLLAVPTGFFWATLRPVLHKDTINRYAAVYKFDPLFIMAVVKTESHFQKTATSHRGAIGLMQLMPDTAEEMASRVGMGKNVALKDLEDPDTNLRLGIHYLSLLREEFKSDWVSVLAAYNAGPANVRAWREKGPLTAADIPFPETKNFVNDVMVTHRWLKRFQKVKNVFNA